MRKAEHLLIPLTLLLGAAACSDAAGPVDVDISPAYGSVNACYAVTGTLEETLVGADVPNNLYYFQGPISGSLEGTSFAALTASDNPAGGLPPHTVFGAGTRTVTVTAPPELAGATLLFELEQVNGLGPGRGGGDRMTLVSGARGGHLTLHGGFNFSTLTATYTYRGSICP